MEASFCGANFGRQCDCHFNSYDLEQMGHYFCDTILDFCDPDQSKVQFLTTCFHRVLSLFSQFFDSFAVQSIWQVHAIRAELEVMYPPKKERNRCVFMLFLCCFLCCFHAVFVLFLCCFCAEMDGLTGRSRRMMTAVTRAAMTSATAAPTAVSFQFLHQK